MDWDAGQVHYSAVATSSGTKRNAKTCWVGCQDPAPLQMCDFIGTSRHGEHGVTPATVEGRIPESTAALQDDVSGWETKSNFLDCGRAELRSG